MPRSEVRRVLVVEGVLPALLIAVAIAAGLCALAARVRMMSVPPGPLPPPTAGRAREPEDVS